MLKNFWQRTAVWRPTKNYNFTRKAYLFDWADDKIVVSNEPAFDLTSGFTIEAEILVTGADAYNAIFTKYSWASDWWELLLQAGIPRMVLRGTSSRDTGIARPWASDLRDGNWHTVKMVNTPWSTTIIIDWVEKAANTATWTPVANNIDPQIWSRPPSALPFRGKMRAIRVRDENDALILDYHCNETSGTTAVDQSGEGNSWTLTNITEATFHTTI